MMKKIVQRILLVSLAAAVLCTSVFAQKADIGSVVDNIRGFAGEAVMADAEGDKVLQLADGTSQTWNFINDADTLLAFEQDIIVSADFNAAAGTMLRISAGGAEYEFEGNGGWQNAALVIYPRTFKYEVFADNTYITEGSLSGDVVSAVSQAVFSAGGGTVYLDDFKVEQWDKAYDDSMLTTLFEDTFETIEMDNSLANQTGWNKNSGNAAFLFANNELAGCESENGYYARFSREESDSGDNRFWATVSGLSHADSAVVSMRLRHPSSDTAPNAKLNIFFNNEAGTRLIDFFVDANNGLWRGSDHEMSRNLYTDDEWFDLKVVMNTPSGTYDVYVNNVKLNDEPVPMDNVPADAASAFTRLYFQLDPTNYGMWYADDIRVSKLSETQTVYTPVLNETFDTWNPGSKTDETIAGAWKFGSRNDWNPTNATFALTTAAEAKSDPDLTNSGVAEVVNDISDIETQTTHNYSSGNILSVKALTHTATDMNNYVTDTQSRRSEAIVAHISDTGYTDNVRVSADIYAVDYMKSDTGASRDNMYMVFGNNYNYNNGNNPRGTNDAFLQFRDGMIGINQNPEWSASAGTTLYTANYTKKAWNHIEAVIDDGKITVSVNGAVGAGPLQGTLKTDGDGAYYPFTDLIFYVDYGRGGWYYLDNIKVETISQEPIRTDLSQGIRTLLLQNTVDEMYCAASDAAYIAEGLYFTKNNGASYETAPQAQRIHDLTPFVLGKAVVRNNTEADSPNIMVVAAVYTGQADLKGVAVAEGSIPAGGTSEFIFKDAGVVCEVDDTARLFVWTDNEMMPLTAPHTVASAGDWEKDPRTSVFVVSDSLSAPYTNFEYPQAGWGELIGNYLDQSKIQVIDYGLGGRSSKSFYNEPGCWTIDGDGTSGTNRRSIMSTAKPGDWVLLSFAHNDEKTGMDDEGNYIYLTDPYGDEADSSSYKYWLNQYYQDCLEKGLNLVMITPMPRRLWDGSRFTDSTFKAYVNAMKEFTAEKGIPLVDNYSAMKAKIESMGEEDSKELFVIFDHSEMTEMDPFYAQNSKLVQNDTENSNYNPETDIYTDNTHTSLEGADLSARAIATGLSRIEAFAAYVIR